MEYYGFDADQAETAVEKYRERFRDTGIFENQIYEGAERLLQSLKECGFILAIASSKPTEFVERILDHFQIRNYFDNITGSYMDGRRTKKSEVIQAVLETLEITKKTEVLMVGDRHHDIEGARQMGIDSAGVSFGYGGREELETAGATTVVDNFSNLEKFIIDKKL